VKLLPDIPDFDDLAHIAGYNMQVMAWKLNVSTRTLQRYCDSKYGQPLHEKLKAIRMARALVMVERAEMTLKGIAHDLGYKQYTHFCRDFKETHGLSPAQWMNNSQEIIPPFCRKHQERIRARLRSLKRDRRDKEAGIRALP
jgi:AraC-like DNA-binding protein